MIGGALFSRVPVVSIFGVRLRHRVVIMTSFWSPRFDRIWLLTQSTRL